MALDTQCVYAECHYVECRYAECRGAALKSISYNEQVAS
jgi:hypothetical protein